ncbi:hypothetical protein C8R42DRAFT_721696 [Lentinula raphanica]|nr:hypothetical protein C8R42DRAFT_721696 [Lentinula raphanica]
MFGLIFLANFVAAVPMNVNSHRHSGHSERPQWRVRVLICYSSTHCVSPEVVKSDLHRVQILNTVINEIRENKNPEIDISFDTEEYQEHRMKEDPDMAREATDRVMVFLKLEWRGPVRGRLESYGKVTCLANGAIEVEFSFPDFDFLPQGTRTLLIGPVEVDQEGSMVQQDDNGAVMNYGRHVLWKLQFQLIPVTTSPPEIATITSYANRDDRILQRRLQSEINRRRSTSHYFEFMPPENPPENPVPGDSVPSMYESYPVKFRIDWRTVLDGRHLVSYGGIAFEHGQMRVGFSFPPGSLMHWDHVQSPSRRDLDVVFLFNPDSRF